MKFWDVVKEVSPQAVRKEAERPFVLALAGHPEQVAAARANVLGPGLTPAETAAAEAFLYPISPPWDAHDEMKIRHSDLLVSLPGGPGLTDFRPADTLQVERVEDLQARIFEHRPELRVPLARRLPGFRELAAEQIIRDVSRVNAEFAAVSGIGQSIPLLAPLFPAVVGADILLLTKNQVLMILRLAGIYGEDLGLKARSREIAGVVGGAFGWRTLARQLAGAVPGALGLPVRAGIAYSGTYAVGKAAQMVFDIGRRPTRQEMLKIYQDAGRLAADTVDQLRHRLARTKQELEEPRKALPPPPPDEIIEEREPAGRSAV